MTNSLEPLPMAGPDFGSLGEEAELVEVEPESKQEILENKDVVVQHVHFEGLGRTKDDIIMYEICDVFKAKNLIDVDVLIDTCQGDDALPNGLDVTFEVTELRRLTGSYNTMVGNNEGSMVLGLKFPNLLGRAEKVTFQFSYGTKETSYGLSFFKPRPGNFEKKNIKQLKDLSSTNVYKVTGQFPWSSLRETDRGISTEYNHAMVIDSRNSTILPKRGDYLGGEAYWAGGLHLYTPLPFRPGRGGFGDLFRTHFFLNAGNLCNLNYVAKVTVEKQLEVRDKSGSG
ncbi:hypothetical protein EK904_004449 [Melospiza melodia maxima]|nr:hypothetical protein EK904_004449 [Melospiza melodia maxima]